MSVYRPKPPRNGRAKCVRAAAFYDLDGTLADLSLVHVTLYVLSNLGEWSGRFNYLLSFAGRAPLLYLAERNDRRVLNSVLFEAFRGISSDRLWALGEEYCERVLIKHLYPRAIEMFEANRAAGFNPVLVTGSPDFVVAPLARHLRVGSFAANRLATVGGVATGRLAPPVIASEEKAAWCASYAAEHNIDLNASWGYADSYYDMAFLSVMGHPAAVNPDRQLRAAAMNRHWPVIYFDHKGGAGKDSANESIDETLKGGPNGAS
jgi:HAD superfamily hydrolase (TIGR01490 family)